MANVAVAGIVLMGVLLSLPAGLAPSAAAEDCDPYPVGRCGAFQRESVVFCYILKSGAYLTATDAHVIAIGAPPPGVLDNVVSDESGGSGLLYARKAPAESLAADPYEAPLPFGSLFREANSLAGLQPLPFTCANFTWFEECHPPQWMGPFNPVAKNPDETLA